MQTEAWQHLSLNGRCMLIELMRLHNGRNNGDIVLGIREAASRLGCSPNHAHKLLRELEDKGFLRRTKAGRFGLGDREASAWRLTMFGTLADRRPSAEYRTWKLPKPAAEAKHESHRQRPEDAHDATVTTVPDAPDDTVGRTPCNGHAAIGSLAGRTGCDTINIPSGEGAASDATGATGQCDIGALRKAFGSWVDDQPRGTSARVAREIGVTAGHLSSFRRGRYGLGRDPAQRLAALLKDAGLPK
ncbi:hypothetical protein [Minwuia thermotolerans]|nr:hypothetical protein [Minwuia thermotolerans]